MSAPIPPHPSPSVSRAEDYPTGIQRNDLHLEARVSKWRPLSPPPSDHACPQELLTFGRLVADTAPDPLARLHQEERGASPRPRVPVAGERGRS
jgi:hypothetical protein